MIFHHRAAIQLAWATQCRFVSSSFSSKLNTKALEVDDICLSSSD